MTFSLRTISDFLCNPVESAILSEPQFLHLVREHIIPQPFLFQKDIVRITLGEKYDSKSIIRNIKSNNSN